jgi:hypothetical protein
MALYNSAIMGHLRVVKSKRNVLYKEEYRLLRCGAV